MNKKRENGLDLLRIFAAFLVCIVHVCNIQRDKVFELDVIDFNYHFFAYMFHMGQAAVACFIALSGTFVVKARSTADYGTFYRKSWKKVVMPTIVFTVFYAFFDTFVRYQADLLKPDAGDVSFLNLFLIKIPQTILGYPSIHMWYMFMLMVVYMLAPFLAMAKEKLGEENFVKAAVVLWILGSVDAVTSPPLVSWSLGYAMDVLGIFSMGYVAHEWAVKRKGKTGLGAALIAAGVGIITLEYAISVLTRHIEIMEKVSPARPHNPLLSLSVFFLIAGFTIIEIDKDFGYPSLLTFWVYLIHPAVIYLLFMAESAVIHVPFTEIGLEKPIFFAVVNTIIVLILSFAISHLIEKFQESGGKTGSKGEAGKA